jgi:hypothetical protein
VCLEGGYWETTKPSSVLLETVEHFYFFACDALNADGFRRDRISYARQLLDSLSENMEVKQMAHWSENAQRLQVQEYRPRRSEALEAYLPQEPAVCLFLLPHGRTDAIARQSEALYQQFSVFCARLHSESVVAILTSPPDAARLLPFLEKELRFQLWVAVKIASDSSLPALIPNRHAALLILTRYRRSLVHTKTRIQYTYCPACGRTTKDYGGKKHVYHEYGTLMSDVWRDIEVDLRTRDGCEPVVERLRDLFGLPPYKTTVSLQLA